MCGRRSSECAERGETNGEAEERANEVFEENVVARRGSGCGGLGGGSDWWSEGDGSK